MRKRKIIVIKVLNIFTWTIITLLSSYVLMKACSIYVSEDMRQTIKELGKEITLDIGISVVNASSPVVKYEVAQEGTMKTKNTLIYQVLSIFPINKYLMSEVIEKQASENDKSLYDLFGDTYLASNLSDNLSATHQSSDAGNDISGNVSLITGDSYYESEETNISDEDSVEVSNIGKTYSKKQLTNLTFLKKNFFIGEAAPYLSTSDIHVGNLIKKNLSIKLDSRKPKILIFHTHSQEAFVDSRSGNPDDTVVGVGKVLANILKEKYDINVIHNSEKFDIVNGKLDRNLAYNAAGGKIPQILKENPSVEVIIDLHRDDGAKRVATINGKKVAQPMFFNGISKNSKGPIDYLYNPNLENNLAFSLQMKLKADELYPNFTKRIYLKEYRFNLNLKPRSLLIELGTDENTVEEAKNAMEPLADILYQVLTGN